MRHSLFITLHNVAECCSRPNRVDYFLVLRRSERIINGEVVRGCMNHSRIGAITAKGPPSRKLMLAKIIDQSGAIHPDYFVDVFMDDKEFHRGLTVPPLWAGFNCDNSLYDMDDDVFRSLCRESAAEALFIKDALLRSKLTSLRRSLLKEEIKSFGDLLYHQEVRHTALDVDDLTRLRDQANVFMQCNRLYFENTSEAQGTCKASEYYHAEYISILAGKLLYGLSSVPGVSEATHRANLESLVEVYRRGYKDVATKYKVTKKDHALYASQAQEEVNRFYLPK